MNAKDTILSQEDADKSKIKTISGFYNDRVLLLQAEKSFKAGIKVVTEYIDKEGCCPECGMGVTYNMWQSKLKEWGLK